MWRAVQVWEGLETPFGASSGDYARRLHWRAAVCWARALLEEGIVPSIDGARLRDDESAPTLADPAWSLAHGGRIHPIAQWAWWAAENKPDAPPPAAMPLSVRQPYCWWAADSKRFGHPIVDTALGLSLAALAAWDEVLHRAADAAGSPMPDVYRSGLRYQQEPYPAENFLDSVALRRRKVGDCEDLASDRAAELRARGIDARPNYHRRQVPRIVSGGEPASTVTLYHIITGAPWGLEDPSRELGMK